MSNENKAGQGDAVAVMYADGTVLTKAECGTAFEICCKVNTPLYTAPPATGVLDPGWRCFQCDERFTDEESAGMHFGARQHQKPACLIDVAEYRAMEARMHSYNEEDAEIHRAMNRMHGEHRTALQREEERGYARALKDTGYDGTSVIVPRELLEAAIERIELHTHFPFSEPQTPRDAENRRVTEELRALLVRSESEGVKS